MVLSPVMMFLSVPGPGPSLVGLLSYGAAHLQELLSTRHTKLEYILHYLLGTIKYPSRQAMKVYRL